MAGEITERVIFESEEEARQFEALVADYEDVEVKREPAGEGIAPIIVLLVIGGAAGVAGALAHWSEVRKGGQVIDLTPNADPWVYRTKDLVYGLVAIKAKDGTVTVDVKEPKGYFLEIVQAVVTAVQSVAEKTVAAVKTAAETAAGDKADVEVSDKPVPTPAAG
jgi:hypothetical protein